MKTTNAIVIKSVTGAEVEFMPLSAYSVRLSAAHDTIYRVDYRWSAILMRRELSGGYRWIIDYLSGDRTPWESKSDFGLSYAARVFLQDTLPELVRSTFVNVEEVDAMFDTAEVDRRRRDLFTLNRQIEDRERDLRHLRTEVEHLESGRAYETYPLSS